MALTIRIAVLILLSVTSLLVDAGDNNNITEAKAFLAEYNEQAQIVYPASIEVSWTFNTDITAENEAAMVRQHDAFQFPCI